MSTSSAPPTQQVTVGTVTGKQFKVAIRPTDTVRDVKIRIEEEEAIPLETQILMFGEKTLKDTAAIRDLGIRAGSRLQLAVHMTAGPGPVTRIRKTKKDDSVVVVLCKQSDGLYMLEFHMKEGEGGAVLDKKDAANQLFKLAQGLPPFILNELTGGEFDDDFENNENTFDEEDLDDDDDDDDDEERREETDEEICEDYFEEEEDSVEDSRENSITSRSDSSYSSLSTATFLSMLDNRESFSRSTVPKSAHKSNRFSSALSKSHRTLLEFSSSARSYNKVLSSQRLNSSDVFGDDTSPHPTDSAGKDSVSSSKKVRPATAISIMRLSKGAMPHFEVIKSRPATAAFISQTSKSMASDVKHREDLTTCVARKKIRPATAISIMRLAQSPDITVVKSRPVTASTSKVLQHGESAPDTISTMLKSKDKNTMSSTETIRNDENLSVEALPPRAKSVRFSPDITSSPATKMNNESAVLPRLKSVSRSAKTPLPAPPNAADGVPRKRTARNSPQKRDTLISRGVGGGTKKPISPSNHKPTNCFTCNKKLGSIAVFKCKCSNFFCSTHRYSDRHQCSFNYKEAGRAALTKENPKIGGNKVSKI